MEIESKTLAGLNKMVKLLELVVEKEEKNLFVELFGIDEKEFKKLDHITFNNAKKILTPLVTKNKKKFNALVDRQKALFKKVCYGYNISFA